MLNYQESCTLKTSKSTGTRQRPSRFLKDCTVQWRGGWEFFRGAKSKGDAKSLIANVKYYTKYVKSSLSTNSKIAGISVAIQLSNSFQE